MLPGFRFLFAAIILSMSVLVFGLGAAALLRAAHEQFASIPSRRAPPEPVFAQQNEPPMPTLALLRFEPAVAEKEPDTAPDNAAAVRIRRDRDAGRASVRRDAGRTGEISRAAIARDSRGRAGEAGNPGGGTMRRSPGTHPPRRRPPKTPIANDEVKLAAIAEPAAAGDRAGIDRAGAGSGSAIARSTIATTKIATLGGSAVTIADPGSAKPKSAKPDRSAIQKRAQRAKELRRIAARRAAALQAQQAAALPQPNPFDPAPVTRAKR